MKKKDLFSDFKRLLKDLENQDHSTVVRSEEDKTKSGLSVKKDTIIRGKVGITDQKKNK
ncbi:hypothetical protein [Salipaludibacillus daqingensis]|uniref:hypothetical protein n=1 Tax=Salipaludibacillus daqingensis TaxID=3041001 RepID=UPI002475F093|nr:hypothetical protein [Salipaludibacillus daqingensis]